jgi:polyhydroxyalkanoate synthase
MTTQSRPDLSTPLGFSRAQALDEVSRFRERLRVGLESLRAAGAVKPAGVTKSEIIPLRDNVQLLRYASPEVRRVQTPLLINYALVNRPYMLDLEHGRSLIEGFRREGVQIYLIDWGYARDVDRDLELVDYLDDYIHHSVAEVKRLEQCQQVNLLGVCQGGILSLLYCAMHPQEIRNLITMVTPVDFEVEGFMLADLVKQVSVEQMADAFGNVPGQFLNLLFTSLKPFELGERKYIKLIAALHDEAKMHNFIRMEKWISDSPDQAGAAFCQFVRWFFLGNGLLEGGFKIRDEEIDLKRIVAPILNIYAEHDHIVPPASSRGLKGLTASPDYSEQQFAGGHIGIYVSGRAQQEIPKTIADWLHRRD